MAVRRLMAAALILAACGSAPEDMAARTPSPTPVPAASPSPIPGPTATGERACTDATVTGQVAVRIAARDFTFRPDCLIVLGGQGLVVRNAGGNTHNFTIEASPVGFDLEPGQVNRTEFVGGAVPPGTYRFYCIYHEARGMEGEITISAVG